MLTWRAASVVYCHEYPNRRYRRRRRRPPGKAQRRPCSCSRTRCSGSQLALNIIVAGLAGRSAGRRSLARHAADFDRRRRLAALGAGDVVVHGTVRSPRRLSRRRARGRRWRPRMRARDVRRQFRAVHGGLGVARRLSSGARASSVSRRPTRRSESFKPKAISWVLAGGLLSALLGPEIVRATSSRVRDRCRTRAPISPSSCSTSSVRSGSAFLDIPRRAARRRRCSTRGGRSPSSRVNPCSSSRCCPRWSGSRR